MSIMYKLIQQFLYEEQSNIYIILFLLLAINTVQTVGISFITANIIDFIKKTNQIQTFLFFKYFICISILYILLIYSYLVFKSKSGSKLKDWSRNNLIQTILHKNNDTISEYNLTGFSPSLSRMSFIIHVIYNMSLSNIIPGISFVLIISLFFLYKNVKLGLGFIIGNIILCAYLQYSGKNLLSKSVTYETSVYKSDKIIQDIFNNIDTIIYRGQVVNEIDILNENTQKSINASTKYNSIVNYNELILIIILYIIIFSSIWYFIMLYFDKKIDFPVFITFFTIILLYRDKILSLISHMDQMIECLGRITIVNNILNEMDINHNDIKFDDTNNIQKKQYANQIELKFEHIKFDNVTFKYNTDTSNIFNKFNIDLYPIKNKIIGINGLSGNGKSTFMKLLIRVYKCNEGAIYIDNKNIDNIDPDYIRKNITYVNQNSNLFDRKVIENILYGCNDEVTCNDNLNEVMKYDKIKELYKKVDIYTKQSGPLGENLSGGQRQITNIIGGLINTSKILILDEPTNALDLNLKKDLISIIKDFKKYKQCIIIITHDRDVYSLFDETITI